MSDSYLLPYDTPSIWEKAEHQNRPDQEASGKVKNNLVIPCMFTVLYVVAYDQGVEKFLYVTV
jgi:hypothetical protein